MNGEIMGKKRNISKRLFNWRDDKINDVSLK